MPGHKFTSENQPTHDRSKAPKKSIKGKLQEMIGMEIGTKPRVDDIKKLLWTLSFKNVEELERIKIDPKTPAFLVVAINAIMGDITRLEIKNTSIILDRVIGKPLQNIKVNDDTYEKYDLSKLSDEDLEKLETLAEKIAS